ncbi:MAG TPA: hypothetical protein VII94_00450 [Candidatus Saccharimonadales bacterium]
MQKKFDCIYDFTKIREQCLFCDRTLRATLTNFIGIKKNGIPILNSPLKDGYFKLHVKHTTENYSVEANVTIDTKTNVLSLSEESDFDSHVLVRQALEDLMPYVSLYCPNRQCKYKYAISSDILKFDLYGTYSYHILPNNVYIEVFRTNKLLVLNDWIYASTEICSIINEDALPIRIPFLDFISMDKDKLLNRIQTFVIFS